MNVLVYAGSGPAKSQASKSIQATLERFLFHSHDIKLVDSELIVRQPWQQYTSLLVFPDDSPIESDSLFLGARRKIEDWAHKGGNILATGSGTQICGPHPHGLVSSVWKQISPRPFQLRIPKKVLDGTIFPLLSGKENGELVSTLEFLNSTDESMFAGELQHSQTALNYKLTTTVIAHYLNNPNQIAALHCSLSSGSVFLMGFGLGGRAEWCSLVLKLMGLESVAPSALVRSLQTCSPLHLVSVLADDTAKRIQQDMLSHHSVGENLVDGGHHRFKFRLTAQEGVSLGGDDSLEVFVMSCDSLVKSSLLTDPPSFDWRKYFGFLQAPASGYFGQPTYNRMGSTIIYAERLTSTQTLLEKNTKLVDHLPSGTVVIAGVQTCGRGRGSNNWISSPGSVQFSILLKTTEVQFGLVFVQYLFGLAAVEWLRQRTGLSVRLKWPNDIYASFQESDHLGDFKKLGGILVHGSFSGKRGDECRLVIGCGLNNNSSPSSSTISLRDLIHHSDLCASTLLESEEIIAGICQTFEKMWDRFRVESFGPFEKSYLDRWLHTGQIVTEEKTGDKLKIVGLSPIYGMLRTEKIPNGQDDLSRNGKSRRRETVDLQPDSNSFDMLSGLIKTKDS